MEVNPNMIGNINQSMNLQLNMNVPIITSIENSTEKKSYMKITDEIKKLVVDNYMVQKRSLNDIAKIFNIPRSSVWNIIKSHKILHNLPLPKGPGGRKKKFTREDAELIKSIAREDSNISLLNIKDKFEKKLNKQISTSTIFTIIKGIQPKIEPKSETVTSRATI